MSNQIQDKAQLPFAGSGAGKKAFYESTLHKQESKDSLSSTSTFFEEEDEDEEEKIRIQKESKEDAWTFSFFKQTGNCYAFFVRSNGIKVIRGVVFGPDYIYVLLSVALFGLYLRLCYPSTSNLMSKVVFLLLFGCALFSHLLASLLDPGILRRYHNARSRHWSYCEECTSYKPPNCSHCAICGVCVLHQGLSFLHHCPYTGKCVGTNNWIAFKTFLYSTISLVVFTIVDKIFSLTKHR